MKKFIIGILGCFFSLHLFSQPVAQEWYHLGKQAFRAYERDSALVYYERGAREARKEKNDIILGKCLLEAADLQLYFNFSDSLDSYYAQAEKIFINYQLKPEQLRARVGLLEMPRRTNPSSTMDAYVKLLHEAESFSDRSLYFLVLEKIVTVHYALENYDEALRLTRKTIAYYQTKQDSVQLGIKYRSLGNFMKEQKKDSAMFYYRKALSYFLPIHAYLYIVYTYQSMAWLQLDRDAKDAYHYLSTADSINRKYHLNSVQLPLILSFALDKMGRTNEAIEQAKISYALGWKNKQLFVAFQSAEALAGYYKSLKNIDSAMFYTEMYAMIKDSIRSEKQYKDAGRMQAKLEYDQKLFEQQFVQKEELKRKELIEYFSLFIGLFCLAVAIVASITYVNYRKKTKVIIAQNEERALLIKEIHHRVKNNLSVISGMLELQYREITDERLQNIFMDAKSRVNSMALIHKNLYEQTDFASTDLQIYFEHLFGSVYQAYKKENVPVQCFIEANQLHMNTDTLIPLALIVNELLTNSFKYAFNGRTSGTIRIEIQLQNHHYMLVYEDDGIGKNTSSSTSRQGLGTRLIEGLTEQLDGKMHTFSDETGLHYRIQFNEIKRA